MKERIRATVGVIPIIIIIIIMFGGIFSGMFTPTEAGAFAAFATAAVATVMKRMNKPVIKAFTKEALMSTCMVFTLIIGAMLFTRFMALSNVADTVKTAVLYLTNERGVAPIGIIWLLVLFYIVAGTFFDELAAVLLTLPIFFPIVVALGFNPVWWCVITVRCQMAGMITPPSGVTLFTTAKVVKVPIGTLYRGVLPFVAADVIHIALLVSFPVISLWFPRIIGMMV